MLTSSLFFFFFFVVFGTLENKGLSGLYEMRDDDGAALRAHALVHYTGDRFLLFTGNSPIPGTVVGGKVSMIIPYGTGYKNEASGNKIGFYGCTAERTVNGMELFGSGFFTTGEHVPKLRLVRMLCTHDGPLIVVRNRLGRKSPSRALELVNACFEAADKDDKAMLVFWSPLVWPAPKKGS
jgi:hypothetical protein